MVFQLYVVLAYFGHEAFDDGVHVFSECLSLFGGVKLPKALVVILVHAD